MGSHRISFYTTPDDILEILQKIESSIKIHYVEFNHHISDNPPIYTSGNSIPSISKTKANSSIACTKYLVLPKEIKPIARKIGRTDGTIRFAYDQMFNGSSIVFNPGGIVNGENIILAGEASTLPGDEKSLMTFKAFQKHIKSSSLKINGYYVTKSANKLLNEGYRLTPAIQSPPQFDIPRQVPNQPLE